MQQRLSLHGEDGRQHPQQFKAKMQWTAWQVKIECTWYKQKKKKSCNKICINLQNGQQHSNFQAAYPEVFFQSVHILPQILQMLCNKLHIRKQYRVRYNQKKDKSKTVVTGAWQSMKHIRKQLHCIMKYYILSFYFSVGLKMVKKF